MKNRLLLICSFLALANLAFAGGSGKHETSTTIPITTRTLNTNRLEVQITDRGCLVVDINTERGGAFWQFGGPDSEVVVYDQGPWIIGKVANTLQMGAAFYRSSYAPGPIIDGRPALDVRPQDSLHYHPYKISRTSKPSDPDFAQWPGDMGAPVAPSGNPILLGDQLIWAVFNGADSTAYPSDLRQPFTHMPVEIHQSFYAHAGSASDTTLLANTVFIEWTFINKGAAPVESCFVGLWTDIDLGWTSRNPFAVDTVLQMGYCWESEPPDTVFAPRALGYTLLYGPRVPDPNSHAMFRGENIVGYRNLPLSSFWGMQNDVGLPPRGPYSIAEAWNLARGYDNAGQVILDSVTLQPTRFPFSGDPVTGTGSYWKSGTEGGAGFMMFSGPFYFAPGDTQWVMLAMVPTGGFDMNQGIRQLRSSMSRLRTMSYGEIAEARTVSVPMGNSQLPQSPVLYQNFPNPFNPTTVVSYQLPVVSHVRLVVYDLLGREVARLVDEKMDAGDHQVKLDATGLSSGVYFYRIQVHQLNGAKGGDYVRTMKFVVLK